MADATVLLKAVGEGDPRAAAELLPVVYQELRRLARAQMAGEHTGHTLQATALVHEAFLRLVADEPVRWDNRRHFFGAAAEAMRRILVEHARHKKSLKRGGSRERVDLADEPLQVSAPCDGLDLLALSDALDRQAAEDPEGAELVKLLYFAGLSLEEAGAAMGLSKTTAHRRWVFARAWLHDAMSGGLGDARQQPGPV
jgi:RNA polymerase sigma factor (TIGR02999 family)